MEFNRPTQGSLFPARHARAGSAALILCLHPLCNVAIWSGLRATARDAATAAFDRGCAALLVVQIGTLLLAWLAPQQPPAKGTWQIAWPDLIVGIAWGIFCAWWIPRVAFADAVFISGTVLLLTTIVAVICLPAGPFGLSLVRMLPVAGGLLTGWTAIFVTDGSPMTAVLTASLGLGFLLAFRLTWERERNARAIAAAQEVIGDLRADARASELRSMTSKRVLSAASHELRQPVQALGLLIEHLRTDPSSAECREQVEDITSVVSTMSRSLETLLDLGRLDAGALKAHLQDIDLVEIFEQLRREFEPLARQKGLSLAVVPQAMHVRSDPDLLHSILGNLIANAIRYTDTGSVLMEVRQAPEATGSQPEVQVVVQDTGPGIDQSQLDAIFEEYHRVHQDDGLRGVGLGLAIVRRMSSVLSHQVQVKSQLGLGTAFSVTLPTAFPPVPSRLTAMNAPASFLQGRFGVLVENDPVILKGMQSMLESWGCTVIPATDCDDLTHRLGLTSRPIDFIITDFHLVDAANGAEVVRRVREHECRLVPALILTGDVEITADDVALLYGVEIRHKPLAPSTLRMILESALRKGGTYGATLS